MLFTREAGSLSRDDLRVDCARLLSRFFPLSSPGRYYPQWLFQLYQGKNESGPFSRERILSSEGAVQLFCECPFQSYAPLYTYSTPLMYAQGVI